MPSIQDILEAMNSRHVMAWLRYTSYTQKFPNTTDRTRMFTIVTSALQSVKVDENSNPGITRSPH